MLLERTICQLDTGPMPAEEARQLAELGYMQWLAGLGARENYAEAAAERACQSPALCRAIPRGGEFLRPLAPFTLRPARAVAPVDAASQAAGRRRCAEVPAHAATGRAADPAAAAPIDRACVTYRRHAST